jgi:hypothetical protein
LVWEQGVHKELIKKHPNLKKKQPSGAHSRVIDKIKKDA